MSYDYVIKKLKNGYYKVYFDWMASDFEIQQCLSENKLRFVRNDSGLFNQYKVVILAEKIK